MKKLFAFILTAAMAISMTACGSSEKEDTSLEDVKSKGKITVAISPDFAPSEFKDPNTGEVLGSDVFVAKYVADKLGVELVIEEMDFKSCIAAVQSGSVDFSVNSFSATADRKENFYCSSPYGMTDSSSTSYQGMLVPADKVGEYKTTDDFVGKKIAVQNTSLQYDLVSSQLTEGYEIEFITNINMGATMLAEGKVDALATTSETGAILCKNFESLAMAEFKFDYTSTGTVAIVNKENVALGDAISAAIEEMTADPNVNWTEIRQQYTDLANRLGVTND